MNLRQKRIFVGNLPPNVKENEIEENFKIYGDIEKVEIKHKKESINHEESPVFAFVTLKIDEITLHKCFQEFNGFDWNGYQVNLQVAKESFLERLKREREENSKGIEKDEKVTPVKPTLPEKRIPVSANKKTFNINTYQSNSDSDSDDELSKKVLNKKTNGSFSRIPSNSELNQKQQSINSYHSSSESEDHITVKSKEKPINSVKNKSFSTKTSYHSNTESEGETSKANNRKGHLEGNNSIKHKKKEVVTANESKVIGNNSFIKNDVKNEKISEAERKRKQSLSNMKNAYIQQKSAIKSALSSIDQQKSNKIVFNDDDNDEHFEIQAQKQNNKISHYNNTSADLNNSNRKRKLDLFDEEDDDSINFNVKKQFEGEHGHKLLQLQSRFTNDRRFTLDSRFVEDKEEEKVDNSLENDEKQKQLEILESVLGKKITNHKPKDSNKVIQKPKVTMTRFDPTKPEHSKYEIKEPDTEKGIKKKVKEKRKEENLEEKQKEPEVSKDTFYKVKGNLKQSLQENQSFSLLSMFGKAEEETEDIEQIDEAKEITKSKYIGTDHNPFKYDSSDSEDETEESNKINKTEAASAQTIVKKEKFFFVLNDERLQETTEFLKKLGMEVKDQPFDKRRRELKKIVKDKIKNNMRNHRPFRRKLGKNKMIKVKKAKKK